MERVTDDQRVPVMSPVSSAGGVARLRRSYQAARLVLRNTRPRPAGPASLRFDETRHSTASGVEYDLYQPRAPLQKTFIMLPGLTVLGERDPRLVNFARSFAESGIRVAAPALAGLKSLRFESSDLTTIKDLVTSLEHEFGSPIGIVAFSIGAGLALTAAADPAVSNRLDPLLVIGPFFSLSELWSRIVAFDEHAPTSDEAWDHHIWVKLALAYRALTSLDLDDAEERELLELIENYCWEPSLDRKMSFYRRVLDHLDVTSYRAQNPDEQHLQEMSPCGKLALLPGRVMILHDSNDYIIPPHHSERIYEELCTRDLPGAQKLVVTPVLAHVTAGALWRILDLYRILDLFGEIFR